MTVRSEKKRRKLHTFLFRNCGRVCCRSWKDGQKAKKREIRATKEREIREETKEETIEGSMESKTEQ